ncbi:MAG: glycosyltransferase family protein, partial [Nanoarchaeota archaeon]
MKILFIGVFGNKWSTNIPMVKALAKLGHHVSIFDFRFKARENTLINHPFYFKFIRKYLINFFKLRLWLPEKFKDIRYYLFGNFKTRRQIENIAKRINVDLIFISKMNNIHYKSIQELKKYAKTWYFFMDPLKKGLQINVHKYAQYSDYCSATFSNVKLFFQKNNENSYFITQGVNTELFHPETEEGNKEKEIDIIFVGTKSPKREFYINYLKKNGIYVKCYGDGWHNQSIYLEDLVEKYRKSKIILNFTRRKIGFSIRVFQALGTGSFVLSEYCRDLEKIFNKREHLDWFHS